RVRPHPPVLSPSLPFSHPRHRPRRRPVCPQFSHRRLFPDTPPLPLSLRSFHRPSRPAPPLPQLRQAHRQTRRPILPPMRQPLSATWRFLHPHQVHHLPRGLGQQQIVPFHHPCLRP